MFQLISWAGYVQQVVNSQSQDQPSEVAVPYCSYNTTKRTNLGIVTPRRHSIGNLDVKFYFILIFLRNISERTAQNSFHPQPTLQLENAISLFYLSISSVYCLKQRFSLSVAQCLLCKLLLKYSDINGKPIKTAIPGWPSCQAVYEMQLCKSYYIYFALFL